MGRGGPGETTFKVIQISIFVIFNKEIMLCKGLYDYFSTKKASASGGFVPWPPPKALSPGPEVVLPFLTIYPGAASDFAN